MRPTNAVRILREALIYVINVRRIECLHKHPGPDESCAKCQAELALKLTAANSKRTTEELGR